LRDTDGVGRGAVASQAQEVGGTVRGVGNVGLVVGAVKVDTIPAATIFISAGIHLISK